MIPLWMPARSNRSHSHAEEAVADENPDEILADDAAPATDENATAAVTEQEPEPRAPAPADESPLEAYVSSLVDRTLAKLVAGDIGLEEAASRLVGTGRFDENQTALDHIRHEVFPKLDEQLRLLEDEISQKQIEADRLRALLGRESCPTLLGGAAHAASGPLSGQEKSRRKGGAQAAEKKRRGFGSAEDDQQPNPSSATHAQDGSSLAPQDQTSDLAPSAWDGP